MREREYDLIATRTGSTMNIVSEILRIKPERIVVIDKEDPSCCVYLSRDSGS